VTTLLMFGIKESARTNNVLVALKCSALIMFVAFCSAKFDVARMTPFMPNGWEGMKTGAADIFFLFVGFDAVSTVAEEALDAQRDMPRGIVAALAIVTVLYVSVGLVLTGMFPLAKLGTMDEPLALGLQVAGHPWAAMLLSLVAVSGILSVLLVGSIGQTRILYIMSRDGLMPKFMANLNPRTGTPVACTLLLGLVTAVLAAVVPISELADLVSIGTLAAFCVVSLAVIVMRSRTPELERKFRCPWVPVLPIAGILLNLYLMTYLSAKIWKAFGIWMTLGLVIYFLWSNRAASKVYTPNEPEPGPMLAES
jgi:APA family basic amino acid/polyamine antiporter